MQRTPGPGPTSSTTSGRRASPPASVRPGTCRSTRTSTPSARRTPTRCSRRTACSPSSAGSRELAITDHVDFDPTMPAYGFASFVDRERDVREAAARWAGRGPRDPVRRGGDLRAPLRGRDPGLAAPAPPRLRDRERPHQRGLAVQGVARRRRSSPGDRSRGSWRPTSTRSSGRPGPGCSTPSATSTSSSATWSRTCCPRSWRPHRSCTSRSLTALVEHGIALEVNASGLRQLPRETYPAAPIVERYLALGGGQVTIGSDAHRTEWFSYGLGEAYRLVAAAGVGALAFRRGAERVAVPVPQGRPA